MMKHETIRRVAIGAGALTIALGAIMVLVTVPRLGVFSGGLLLFDARWGGYSLNEARHLFAALGSDGIAYYRYRQVPLDMVFAIAYGLALGFTIIALQRGAPRSQGRVAATLRSILYVAPFLATAFDLWENRLIFRMLGESMGTSPALVAEASRTTTYKWTFVAIAVFGVGLSLLRYSLRKRGRARLR